MTAISPNFHLLSDSEIANQDGKDCAAIAEKRGLTELKGFLQGPDIKKKRFSAPPPYSNEEADWELLDPMDSYIPDETTKGIRGRAMTQLTSLLAVGSSDRKRSMSKSTTGFSSQSHTPPREKSPIPAAQMAKMKDTITRETLERMAS